MQRPGDLSVPVLRKGQKGESMILGLLSRSVSVYGQWHCDTCNTYYISKNDDATNILEARVLCNEQVILLCPWCREDSTPNRYGRCERGE